MAAQLLHDPVSGSGGAQIVTVRPEVVETVGHVLGNLFQRLYHLISEVRPVDPGATGELGTSARQLEQFLQLVMDYFSPIRMDLQYVPSTELAQSLGRQLSDCTGVVVKIDARLPAEAQVLADAGTLSRAFGLLAALVTDYVDASAACELRVAAHTAPRSLMLAIALPSRIPARRPGESEIRWAVAEKFFELHGGALYEQTSPSGELLWEIVLPLHS